MSPSDAAGLAPAVVRADRDARARRRMDGLYPDAGPLARSGYGQHLEFFARGLEAEERAFIAANRSGKSTAAGYELVCHLTGVYPHWWDGFRFDRPIAAWAAGVDLKAVRESVQPTLFGPPDAIGTGIIPGDAILSTAAARGAPDLLDSATISHASGGRSRLVLKTYEQGRESFQGAKIDVCWLDEEPPRDVYSEALTRLMSTTPGEPNGRMMCTFTPLLGLSDVAMYFLGDNWAPSAEGLKH